MRIIKPFCAVKAEAKIEKIAVANLSMPTESTYILPKLGSCLTIYEL